MTDVNERAVIGDNNPPEETPFDLARQSIDDLNEEAKHWLDGGEVSSQGEADAVAKLLDMARKAKKEADTARKAEAKPFDDGKKAVQARYKPLLESADLVSDACKKANLPWLKKLEDEKRAKEAEARRIADEEFRKAQEAIQAAAVTDLEAREEAEAQIRKAKDAEKIAKRAANEKVAAKGGARAMSLRTVYRFEITDARDFARWCWTHEHAALVDFLETVAKRRVDRGSYDMPGVRVIEDKVAV